MKQPLRSWRAALVGSAVVGITVSLGGIAAAGTPQHLKGAAAREQARAAYVRTHTNSPADSGPTNNHTPDDSDLADQFAQYEAERTAPAGAVSGDALTAAQQAASALPRAGGAWQEFTNEPYNGQPSNYTDPFWSNVGAGFSLVGGRTTALTTDPGRHLVRRHRRRRRVAVHRPGRHWTPVFDAHADAVDRRAGRRPGRRVAVGGHRRGQRVAGLLRGHRRVPVRPTTARRFTRVGDTSSGSNPIATRDRVPARLRPGRRRLRGHRQRAVPVSAALAAVGRGAGPGRPGRQPALRPAGHRRGRAARLGRQGGHRRDRLARAGQHRSTTASTSRPTAA